MGAGSWVQLRRKPLSPVPQQLADRRRALLVKHCQQAVPSQEHAPVVLLRVPHRLLQPLHIPHHRLHLPLHPLNNSFQPLNTSLSIPCSRGCKPILLPHFIHPARQLTLEGVRGRGLCLRLHGSPSNPWLYRLPTTCNFPLISIQRHLGGQGAVQLLASLGRSLLQGSVRHSARCPRSTQQQTNKALKVAQHKKTNRSGSLDWLSEAAEWPWRWY